MSVKYYSASHYNVCTMAQAVGHWPLTMEAKGLYPGQSIWDLG
jgi:hypothetical protein